MESFDTDDARGAKATIEELTKLKAIFKKDGTVTAGNASGISDGAGTIILADEATVKENNLTPLARIAGYHVSGCDPKIMGIGPVPAIQSLLKKNNLTIDDISVTEVSIFKMKYQLAIELFIIDFIYLKRLTKLLLHNSFHVEKH